MGVLDWIFPEHCALCGRYLSSSYHGVCSECAGDFVPVRDPRCARCGRELLAGSGLCVQCRAADGPVVPCLGRYVYNESVARLLAQFKAHADRRLAAWLATELASLCAAWLAEDLSDAGVHRRTVGAGDAAVAHVVLVPMPGSPESIERRGWDHMQEVGCVLRKRGFRVYNALRRAPGPAQKRLNREDRRLAIENSLVPTRRARRGDADTVYREAIILDDVRTTGASMDAAASLLRDYGWEVIGGAVLALR